MKTLILAPFALSATTTVLGKGCSSLPGLPNGECVRYYKNDDCDSSSGGELGSYKPTCEGNCFQYSSFSSVQVSGDDLFGTDCHLYSDNNCQNQVDNTGNQVSTGGVTTCATVPGAQSMKCYYRC